MIAMNTRSKILVIALALSLAGCASYRNTALDNQLPDFGSVDVSLNGFKPVQSRAGQNPDVAFAVAISGGGHRAANLATGVLLGLESTATPQRNLLREVDYFSTASGGGFAAGVYISALHDHLESENPKDFRFDEALHADKGRQLKNLRRDYQTSIFTQWIHWRCVGFRDAGDLIERDFDRYLLGAKYRPGGRSLTLGDLFKPEDSTEPVQLPYWIANATVYENGARFMFTPEFIERYRIQRYVHNMHYQELNDDPLSLPLSVGMKASASFPVLIPASTFTCRPKEDQLNKHLHLVDGGLTDNLGIQTALELLENDPAPRKVLLVIDAYAKSEHPYSAYRKSPDGPGVAYRVMNIGLDAQHVSLNQNVMEHAKATGIDVLFLQLDDPQRSADTLFEKARSVPTSLIITRSGQDALLKAGQDLVELHKPRLLQLISSAE